MRALLAARVFLTGVRDAWQQPDVNSSGMTYPDPVLNETYDRGVNLGQYLYWLAH